MNDAAGMFNERGYLTANSLRDDGNVLVNDFNGNLMYTHLLHRMPLRADNKWADIRLTYNGSAGHTINAGPYDYNDQFHFNAPTWIVSVNNYAVQTLNFENEMISWFTTQTESVDDDVSLWMNGYHRSFHRASGEYGGEEPHGLISILMGDGSIRSFYSDTTAYCGYCRSDWYPWVGGYRTLDKSDRAKGFVDTTGQFTLFETDGTRVRFIPYLPRLKSTPDVDEEPLLKRILYLPVEIDDPIGTLVKFEYDSTMICGADTGRMYGRPLLTHVNQYAINWGGLSVGDTVSTVSFGSLADPDYALTFVADDGSSGISLCGEKNRAMVKTIEDPIGREWRFDYKKYKRYGWDAQYLFYNLLEGGMDTAVGHHSVSLPRLWQITVPKGGLYSFSYYKDSATAWPAPGRDNSDSLWLSRTLPCSLDQPPYPCEKTDHFLDIGRDPYFINIVTAMTRYADGAARTDVMSRDSFHYSWKDNYKVNEMSWTDTLLTTRYSADSIPSSAVDHVTLEFKFMPVDGALSSLVRDRGWAIRLIGESVYDSASASTVHQVNNYWDFGDSCRYRCQGTLLLDSSSVVIDGIKLLNRYSYEFDGPADSLKYNTLVQLSETDSWDVTTTDYYDTSHISVGSNSSVFLNRLIDSTVVNLESDVLSKRVSTFYSDTSCSGYIGQLRTSSVADIRDGNVYQWLTTGFEYWKNVARKETNGGLFRKTNPNGSKEEFYFESLAFDSIAVDAPGHTTTVDSFETRAAGNLRYRLSISNSYGNGKTWAKVFYDGALLDWISGCFSCETIDSLAVDSGKTVIVKAQSDSGDADPIVEAQAVHFGSGEVLNQSMEYLAYNEDGTVDTTIELIEDTGPFWIRALVFVHGDTIVTYQQVDSLGLPRKTIDANGTIVTMDYDDVHRIGRIVLPYSFRGQSFPIDSVYTLRYEYDDCVDDSSPTAVTRVIRPKADVFEPKSTTRFDGMGRAFQSDLADSTGSYDSVLTTYDYRNRNRSVIDQLGQAISSNYDALNRRLSIIFPDASASSVNWAYTSDSAQNFGLDTLFVVRDSGLFLTIAYDENGDSVYQYFDIRGQMRIRRRFLLSSAIDTYLDYDGNGNLTTIIKPEGDSVSYTYNSLGWLLSELSVDYGQKLYEYDSGGRVVATQDGVLALVAGTSAKLLHHYDDLGRKMASGRVDVSGVDTTWKMSNYFFYDLASCSLSAARPSIAYSNENGYSNAERFDYDARGRIREKMLYFNANVSPVLDDSANVVREDYIGTSTGELVAVRSGFVRYHLFRYWTFDSSSHIIVYKNGAPVDTSIYPDILETTDDSVFCATGDTISVELTIGINHPTIQMTATLWQPPTQNPERIVDGDSLSIAYTYNLADQLTSITYPDGMVVTYDYDDRGRLKSVGDTISATRYATFSYTDRNEIDTMVLGDSLQVVDYTYNERGWLTGINDGQSGSSPGDDLFGQRIFYDSDTMNAAPQYNGNIAATLESTEGGYPSIGRTYKYDDMNRLDSVFHVAPQGTGLGEAFTYDDNGNFIAAYNLNLGSLQYQLSSNSNQIGSVTGRRNTAFAYDANGNMIADTARLDTILYDVFGQLDTVFFDSIEPGKPHLAMGYNTSGERIYKKYHYWYEDTCDIIIIEGLGGETEGEGGGGGPIGPLMCWFEDSTVTYYVRGSGKVLAEYKKPQFKDSAEVKFIYAGDQRIAMVDKTGQVFYHLTDHLGSTRVVFTEINDTVLVQDKHLYYAYGSMWSETVSTNQSYKYTGQEYDDDAGFDLYYYGARYYDADLGVFRAVDPVVKNHFNGSPYSHCLNNPIVLIDPDGRDPSPFPSGPLGMLRFLNDVSVYTFNQFVDGTIEGAKFVCWEHPEIGALIAVVITPGLPDEYVLIGIWAGRTFTVVGLGKNVSEAVESGEFKYVAGDAIGQSLAAELRVIANVTGTKGKIVGAIVDAVGNVVAIVVDVAVTSDEGSSQDGKPAPDLRGVPNPDYKPTSPSQNDRNQDEDDSSEDEYFEGWGADNSDSP